jgi:hypothetical protein
MVMQRYGFHVALRQSDLSFLRARPVASGSGATLVKRTARMRCGGVEVPLSVSTGHQGRLGLVAEAGVRVWERFSANHVRLPRVQGRVAEATLSLQVYHQCGGRSMTPKCLPAGYHLVAATYRVTQ